jgi:hypothetical protein
MQLTDGGLVKAADLNRLWNCMTEKLFHYLEGLWVRLIFTLGILDVL